VPIWKVGAASVAFLISHHFIHMKCCNNISGMGTPHTCQYHDVPINPLQRCVHWCCHNLSSICMMSCLMVYPIFCKTSNRTNHRCDDSLGPGIVEGLPHLRRALSTLPKWLFHNHPYQKSLDFRLDSGSSWLDCVNGILMQQEPNLLKQDYWNQKAIASLANT
jgi:hypothetical protein